MSFLHFVKKPGISRCISQQLFIFIHTFFVIILYYF